jgi:hypothetical protein
MPGWAGIFLGGLDLSAGTRVVWVVSRPFVITLSVCSISCFLSLVVFFASMTGQNWTGLTHLEKERALDFSVALTCSDDQSVSQFP